METQLRFIIKVFLLSMVISLLIKYSDLIITINPTARNGIIIVILPSLILGLTLIYRSKKYSKLNE